jgi:hypothetical protein
LSDDGRGVRLAEQIGETDSTTAVRPHARKRSGANGGGGIDFHVFRRTGPEAAWNPENLAQSR